LYSGANQLTLIANLVKYFPEIKFKIIKQTAKKYCLKFNNQEIYINSTSEFNASLNATHILQIRKKLWQN